jgi:hypothetical protein
VNRNPKVAIYKRTVKSSGQVEGYEVFKVNYEEKGKVYKFPNGTTRTLEDDKEKYPASSQFGMSAWSTMTYERACQIFDRLTAEAAEKANPSVKAAIVIPDGEFTVGELAEKNKIDYAPAFLFIKAALVEGSVKFLREEKRNARGKASKIYTKA